MCRIPADEWARQREKQEEAEKLKKKFYSEFLFRRHTCGICRDGIRFQSAWVYHHEDEEYGGYGFADLVVSYICKKCAPTREQAAFLSVNFPKDMPKYKIRECET